MRLFAAIIAAGSLCALLWAPEASARQACSANIQPNVKYHYTTYKGGRKTGWIMFTTKQDPTGKLHRIIIRPDRTKKKLKWWGTYGATSFKAWDPKTKRRWTAYSKYCKGHLLYGSEYVRRKLQGMLTVDTSKIRR